VTSSGVADVIRARAPERGDAVAIVDDHRELTYAALDERPNRLARALPAQAVGPGDRMAYLDHTSPEVVELLFAVGKIGVVIVPMNWRLAAAELLAVLTDYCAQVLIAGRGFGSRHGAGRA